MKTSLPTWKDTLTFKKSIKYWFLAIRIKTLPAGIAPVLFGLGLAQYELGHLNIHVALLTLLTTFLLQISSNLINDYYDGVNGIDDDSRIGPTRVTQAKLIPAIQVRNAYLLTTFASVIIGLYLSMIGGLPILITGIISIIFCYLYTGGPKPLSHLGLGEGMAIIFFGIVATNGTYFLQTFSLNRVSLVLGLIPGLISATILGINNLRDTESDSKNGKKTLSVILGPKFNRYIPLTFLSLSFLLNCYFVYIYRDPFFFTPIAIALFFKRTWMGVLREKISPSFNLFLANTGKYLFLTSIFFFSYFYFKGLYGF